MNKISIKKIFEKFEKTNPTPTTELQFNNHFELLIAVMLSAQATDISVNKATKHLFPIANTPEKIVSLGVDELESLPGVGRKTANVILNTAFDEHTIAVDTHIFRVANRTGLAKGKTPRAVEDGLLKIIPKKYLQHAHHWLVLHGRYICTARNPKCSECPIEKWCEYESKTTLQK